MKGLAAPLIKLIMFAVITIISVSFLALTIANIGGGRGDKFNALFDDVTLLNKGDDVRIAGVRVGQVTKVSVVNRNQAEVEFAVPGKSSLPASTLATIRYRNLAGQRYLSLTEGSGDQGRKLNPGDTIPIEQTKPALNLTTLFDGFRPLFQTLNPDDVNKLAYQLIQVFQGEGGTVAQLVSNTATLTNTIADKDQVIGQVVTNLNSVLETVNANDEQLSQMITSLDQLVTGLSNDRTAVGESLQSLALVTGAAEQLITPARPSIQADISRLGDLATTLNANKDSIDSALKTLPIKLDRVGRAASFGSYFNFYLCGLDLIVGPGTEAPQLNLPSGLPILNQPLYTNSAQRCQPGGMG